MKNENLFLKWKKKKILSVNSFVVALPTDEIPNQRIFIGVLAKPGEFKQMVEPYYFPIEIERYN